MNNKIYSNDISNFRTVALVVMLVVAFAGIADAQVTGQTKQGLAIRKVRLWTENNNVVPVCWETQGYDREKQIVEEAVINTWQKYTNITFTGWGICPAGGIAGSRTAKDVRIRISAQAKNDKGVYPNAGADGSARVGMDALSSAADNDPGVNMSFAPDGSASKGRVEYIAVHEFGHVLGFIHEQDAPNHDRTHCAGGVEAGATSLTDYDPDSIMNYCNRDGNVKGNLTAKDIAGLEKLYGARLIKGTGNQNNWRFCDKCFSLFFDGYASKGLCPTGGGHRAQGYNFLLAFGTPETTKAQTNWRFCDKCHVMFFEGYPTKGSCPGGQGGHRAQGWNFTIPHDVSSNAKNQSSWRYCSKCYAMFFSGYPTKGSCPAGGGHTAQGYDFVLPHSH